MVEDNPASLKLIEMTLRPHGYMLLKATDGEEALEKAVKENPDLIIMDIQLPKISGLEVTKKLRQMPEFHETHIIAVTAYAMKGDEERMIEAGCDAYLAKPIDTDELSRVVAEMMKRRKQESKQ
ncbi:response regulator [Chloroflexota bacterium]